MSNYTADALVTYSVSATCGLTSPQSTTYGGNFPGGITTSPLGNCLAAWNDTITLFTISGCTLTETNIGPASNVSGAAFSPDGSCIAAVGTSGLYLLSVSDCAFTGAVTSYAGIIGSQVAFSPDGACLAVINIAATTDSIALYSVNQGTCTLNSTAPSAVASLNNPEVVAFAPNSACLIVAGSSAEGAPIIQSYSTGSCNALTPTLPFTVAAGTFFDFAQISFSPTGDCFAVAYANGTATGSSAANGGFTTFNLNSSTCAITPVSSFSPIQVQHSERALRGPLLENVCSLQRARIFIVILYPMLPYSQ